MTNSKTNKPQPTRLTRRQTFIILFFGGIVAYILWNTESLAFIAYPFRLFVTYIHEAGHSIAAILTGGQVVQFTVSPDGSGLATTMGGSRFVILPAGYLGAAFFGSVLFYLLYRFPHPRQYAALIGAFLVIFTALYARPDGGGAWTAVIVGIVFGIMLIGMAWKATPHLSQLLLTVLALLTATNALLDVHYLTRINNVTTLDCRLGILNDAARMACEFGASPGFWAVVWMGLALAMLGASVYFSLIRPFMRGLSIPEKAPNKPTPTPVMPRQPSPKPPPVDDDPLKSLKRDADGEIDFSQFSK